MGVREDVTKMAGKRVRFIAYSCVHGLFEDLSARDALRSAIRHHKPDFVVCLGDICESSAASKWENEDDIDLKDEYDHVNDHLQDIRETTWAAYDGDGEPYCVLLEGNHDANIRAANRIPKKLRSLCQMEEHIDELASSLWHMPARYIYDKRVGVFRLGHQVCFSHGYETGTSGVKREVLYMMPEYGLYIHGHTHRPRPVQQIMRTQDESLRYWSANTGCLRDLKPEYVERKNTSKWGQGYVVGECEVLKAPRTKPYWSAETVVIQSYDQWSEKNLATTDSFFSVST